MPNPATGSGADVSKGLQKYTYALYLSDASGAGAAPLAKLLAQEPASPWVRQGRLRDDTFTWNVPAPSYLDGRAGFKKVLKFRVVNQAELVELTIPMDEADPNVQAKLRGTAGTPPATSLSSGAYTGYQFIYKAGIFYAAKVLLIGTAVTGTKERHLFAGNCVVVFKEINQPEYDGLEAVITFLDDSSGNQFTFNEWD